MINLKLIQNLLEVKFEIDQMIDYYCILIIMEDNRDLKVMLIGNSSVGKTSLILKYKSKKFSSNLSSTVGVDMTVDKNVTING